MKKTYTHVSDFTPDQVQKFDTMHKALRDYNSKLRKGSSPVAPAFTDDEMSLYSTYRQFLLASRVENHT